jgi:hypothetical protein
VGERLSVIYRAKAGEKAGFACKFFPLSPKTQKLEAKRRFYLYVLQPHYTVDCLPKHLCYNPQRLGFTYWHRIGANEQELSVVFAEIRVHSLL